MTLPLELVGVLIIAVVAWFMWDSLKAREAAVAASKAACAAEGLLFLDDTVAIRAIRPVRGDDGHVRLRRIYGFEYSESGDSRRKGTIVLAGDKVLVVNLQLPTLPPRPVWF
jgi:hypothetical protein